MNTDGSSSSEIMSQGPALGGGINRRQLLQGALASAASIPLLAGVARADEPPALASLPAPQTNVSPKGAAIKATVGAPIAYSPYLHGDTWNPTWADDDNLYSIACDTLGNKDQPTNSNLAVYKFSGGPPPNIKVEIVNSMPQFGHCAQVWPEDNCCWKGTGLLCVDGVLYLAAARNHYGDPKGFYIQQVWDSVIIKSADHGKTWSDVPAFGKSMFPGHTFANPSFIQYGKDGAAGPHGSDKYIYAVSNDGAWNNGNAMVLGRVPRNKIGNLNAADWEFVNDLDKDYQPVWKPDHKTAMYIFRAPGQCGFCGLAYLPGINQYILTQWHYPSLNQWPAEAKWSSSRFQFYSSPTPWGPWSLFHTHDCQPQGFYNPTIMPKFTSADGKSFWLVTAGDFSTSDHPYYGVNMIPVTLEVA
jgi:hypothetical protein